MALTEQHLDFIKGRLVEEFTEYQTSDRYWFDKDQVTLLWVSNEEMWYALKPNKTWEYYTSSDIDCFVDTLTTEQLTAWMIEEFGCDADDLEEYINDELEVEE